MELICEKYKVKMVEAQAECAHPAEYCKFRTACVINFLTRERQRQSRQGDEPTAIPDSSALPKETR